MHFTPGVVHNFPKAVDLCPLCTKKNPDSYSKKEVHLFPICMVYRYNYHSFECVSLHLSHCATFFYQERIQTSCPYLFEFVCVCVCEGGGGETAPLLSHALSPPNNERIRPCRTQLRRGGGECREITNKCVSLQEESGVHIPMKRA